MRHPFELDPEFHPAEVTGDVLVTSLRGLRDKVLQDLAELPVECESKITLNAALALRAQARALQDLFKTANYQAAETRHNRQHQKNQQARRNF